MNNLSLLLSGVGRREEAVVPIVEAVEIYRRLAEVNPTAYEPGLAMSLNTLSLRLSGVGRREEAVVPIVEAV
ncbi:tetratricopeptide repeat protein, partial [Cryobacterium sp. MDB2-A-2]|uniref:tetratricopeptide repeat protein n=1 Tax=Cryobacterium sp. MDB2-A-2 TaxID=1259182 RepID=UPI00106A01F6